MPATTPARSARLRRPCSGCVSVPKRKEFIAATGRAPIVKMSRRIPPTPVAAPWKGSMKEGWLCDSTLKAAHQPSPTSTMPAFSPGGTMTRSPLVGSLLRWTREDLYEQCSDHMTEKTPSSTNVGSRPSSSRMRSNSSEVRLCAATTSGVMISEFMARKRREPLSVCSSVRRTAQDKGSRPFLQTAVPLFLPARLRRFIFQRLVERGAQLVGFDATLVFEDDVARAVVEEGRGQLAAPRRVYEVDGDALVGGFEEVGGQTGGVLLGQELGHGLLDLRRVVERDEDEVEPALVVLPANLDEVG